MLRAQRTPGGGGTATDRFFLISAARLPYLVGASTGGSLADRAMPFFVVKVTLANGDLASPITVSCRDEKIAVALVKQLAFIGPDDKVEGKGIRQDVMQAAFGDQPEGSIVTRPDWVWRGDEPSPK